MATLTNTSTLRVKGRPYNAVIIMKRTSKAAWFEDEDFWRETYAFMFPRQRFEVAPKTVKELLALTKVRGRTALDLCCGPGRHSIALAQRGFSVTGVDRTKYLLNKARARARRLGVIVEWVLQDMRNFVRPNAYDLALSMFTSFGYFETRSEDKRVLGNIFASLRPGGVLVMDIHGKEMVARNFQPSFSNTLPDGSMFVEDREIAEAWSRSLNTCTVIRKGRVKQFHLSLNLYSGQELKDALTHAGFTDVNLYGSLDGTPYGLKAGRLIAVGRKAKSRLATRESQDGRKRR
jgi:SAM-dependent methyltransferase